MQLVKDVYALTKNFPAAEMYGLSNQLQRAAVSIPSNIAEGSGRMSKKDFAHFLTMALGSAYEVETQLLIAKELGYVQAEQLQFVLKAVNTVQKQLNLLIREMNHSE